MWCDKLTNRMHVSGLMLRWIIDRFATLQRHSYHGRNYAKVLDNLWHGLLRDTHVKMNINLGRVFEPNFWLGSDTTTKKTKTIVEILVNLHIFPKIRVQYKGNSAYHHMLEHISRWHLYYRHVLFHGIIVLYRIYESLSTEVGAAIYNRLIFEWTAISFTIVAT